MFFSLCITEYYFYVFFYRYGGTIYAFLFSSDIVNNLAVAALSKSIKEKFGYQGLFLIISAWGIVALLATLMYPRNPSPLSRKNKKNAATLSSGEKPEQSNEQTDGSTVFSKAVRTMLCSSKSES